MALKTHTWIALWFLITTPIVLWDAGYLFMRPRSMKGGDLHWIWEPYGKYQEVDYVYGLPSYLDGDGFPNAQAMINIVETVLNLAYVYLAHISKWPGAPLIGFTSAVMTLSKTVLYLAQEYYCHFCATGQNTLKTWIIYWIIPNGFWIVFPTLIVIRLGRDLSATLVGASGYSSAKKRK
ncbi:hypothetical protein F5887DRAFT_955649 [Amanita rubescens]|nr:hypothetical protein F5887DRAFT_955649 [Amanita rubescens]